MMSAAMVPDRAEYLAAVLTAADGFRDRWIPVEGTRPSGFVSPMTMAPADVAALGPPAERSDEAAADLDLVTLDPRAKIIDFMSDGYPEGLRGLDGRPALLFTKGALPSLPGSAAVAIVGSRQASSGGLAAAREVSAAVAISGSPVISGLAAGIDAAAHRGALAAGGKTVAVMGTGLGKVFPADHVDLARQIMLNGALVTQFPPGFGPTKTTFPARNALIAGLSNVSLLIEMSERSGTRIEANCAIAQGRTVLLWEPLLGGRSWAQEFATHPRVHFVSSSTEVIERMEQWNEEAGPH